MHQPPAVDSRRGWITVDQRAQDFQRRTDSLDLETDTRSLLHRLRKARRIDQDRKTTAQRRQDFDHQACDLVGREVAARPVVVSLARTQFGFAPQTQRVAAEDHAVAKGLAERRVRLDPQTEALAVVLEPGAWQQRPGVHLDGGPVQFHVAATGETREEPGKHRRRQQTPPVNPESDLRGQIGLRGLKARPVHPAFGDGGQGSPERSPLTVADHAAFERQATLLTLETVADPSHGNGRDGWIRAALGRPAPRDDRGGHMLAGAFPVRAVAVPVEILGEQRDLRAEHAAAKGDAVNRLVVVYTLADHGVGTVEFDTAGPDPGGTGLPHGVEQRPGSSCHDCPPCAGPDPTGVTGEL